MKVSICIPCYEMKNLGATFLHFNLTKILFQTYNNIEIVISDHSQDDSILNVCKDFSNKGLEIIYLRNKNMVGNSSANLNKAIRAAKGDIIKVIFQDDFFYHNRSIEDIVREYQKNNNIKWLVTSCCHTENGSTYYDFMNPKYTENILEGNNRISSPSVLSFINSQDKLLFDPDFVWLMDCDYYYRMYQKYGNPYYLKTTNVVNRHWVGQLTKTLPSERMEYEHKLILKKHGHGIN
ncbi:glycosyltransferase family 2 protein [bacterium]|nr:glycosyltransferase family 2 protein [bacterium]